MDCQNIRKLIPTYLDQELDNEQTAMVKDHTSKCVACQKELNQYQKSWDMLDHLQEIEPDPHYMSRFWTKVSEEKPWYETILDNIRTGLFANKLIPALAVSCFLFVMSFTVFQRYQSANMDQQILELSKEDYDVVSTLELVENLDIIEDIDLIEELDIIDSLDTTDNLQSELKNIRKRLYHV